MQALTRAQVQEDRSKTCYLQVPDAVAKLQVRIRSSDSRVTRYIQLRPVASGESLNVTPRWMYWPSRGGYRDPFRIHAAGAEPYGPKLYIGRGCAENYVVYDWSLDVGKARSGLGLAIPTRSGEEDACCARQILQNLHQYTWIPVDSQTIGDVARSRGVRLEPGVSFARKGKYVSSPCKGKYACRVQFTSWQRDPTYPRNGAKMTGSTHHHDSHVLPGNTLLTTSL